MRPRACRCGEARLAQPNRGEAPGRALPPSHPSRPRCRSAQALSFTNATCLVGTCPMVPGAIRMDVRAGAGSGSRGPGRPVLGAFWEGGAVPRGELGPQGPAHLSSECVVTRLPAQLALLRATMRPPGARSWGSYSIRQGRAPVGRRRRAQAEGFLSFLYWGRERMVHTGLCAGPYVHTAYVYTHRMRPGLWWARRSALSQRVLERGPFQRTRGI